MGLTGGPARTLRPHTGLGRDRDRLHPRDEAPAPRLLPHPSAAPVPRQGDGLRTKTLRRPVHINDWPLMTSTVLKRRALRIEQHPTIPLYVFTLAAEEVHQVADVARISRDEAGKLIGYQRPEKKQHVRQILEYL